MASRNPMSDKPTLESAEARVRQVDPLPPNPSTRDYAYHRLGVRESDVMRLPQITPQLRMIEKTIRRAGQPGRKRVPQILTDIVKESEATPAPYGPGADLTSSWTHYLQASESPDARAILDVYLSLPRSLAVRLPVEAYCYATGVSPLRILEVLVATIIRLGAQASSLIAAVNHPRVVQKTVEVALTDEGHSDRETLHKATGFLPTPKGSHTVVQITQNAQASASAQAASVAAPPPEETIRRLADRFHGSRLAGAPVPAITEHSTESLPIPAMIPSDAVEAEAEYGDPDDPNDDDSP